MIKKLLQFLSVTCVLLSMSAVLVSADKLEDIEESKYKEEINIVYGLGIMDETDYGMFSPNEYLTREEAAKAVARLMAFDGYTGKNMSYVDVADEAEEKPYIDALSAMGIMVGYNDKLFGYGDSVSVKQFQTILLRATGYTALSSIMSFEQMLDRSGLMDGISLAEGEITREAAACILCNALETEEISHDLTNEGEYVKNGTVLENRLRLEEISGVVTGNSITRLSSAGGVEENAVEIDSVKFDVAFEGADEMLGYPIIAYNSLDNEEIVYMYKDEKGYETTVVNDYNINKLVTDGVNVTLSYKENERNKTEVFTIKDNVLKNSSAISELTNESIAVNMGKVVIVELKSGKRNVFIESYENYIVGYVNTKDYIIVDKTTGSEIDFNPADKTVIYSKFGYDVDFSQISIGDVISVYDSKSKPGFIRVFISDDKEEGSVTNVDEEYVYINSKAFRPAKGVDLGKYVGIYTGIFYIDSEGRVAGMDEEVDTSVRYGYLIKVFFDIEKQDTDPLKLTILDDTGVIKEYLAAKKIKIDGVAVYEDWDSFSTDPFRNSDRSHKGQLVKYQLNYEGRVSRLYTQNDTELGPVARDTDFIEQGYRKNSYGMFHNNTISYFLSGDTVMFLVPDKYSEKTSQYSVINTSYFPELSWHKCMAYDVDEYKLAGALLVTIKGTVDAYSTVLMVNSVYKGINADDDVVTFVKGMRDKKEVIYELDSGVTAPQKGDIIQVSCIDDVINTINPMASATDIADEAPVDDFHNDKALGTLAGIKGEHMRIEFGGGADLAVRLTNNTSYYIWCNETGRFEAADKNSMKMYKKVFTKITTGNAVDVVLFD